MKRAYVTEGSVRGRCPHKHRTLEAAERCLANDRAGCHQQGGYSDRQIMALEDGRAVPLTKDEELFLWRCDA
jgi:hypothetical protein